MEYGFYLPSGGPAAQPDNLASIARLGDQLGFFCMVMPDHVVQPRTVESQYPYSVTGDIQQAHQTASDERLEQVTTLAWLAGITESIKLVTSVMIIPYRNPILTAKMLSTLDMLSKGRLILGAGVGWMEEEFEILHAPYHERGAQTDEYLQAMKILWTEQEPQFEGRYEKFADIRCEPKPVQKPHPPIWIGGHSKAALRRTATLADGWYGHVLWRNPDALPREIQTIRQFAEQAGRDPDALTYAALAYEQTPEDVLRALPRYQQAGLDHVVLAFFMWTQHFDDMLKLMERFAKEVGLRN